jgi:hypothetical protein
MTPKMRTMLAFYWLCNPRRRNYSTNKRPGQGLIFPLHCICEKYKMESEPVGKLARGLDKAHRKAALPAFAGLQKGVVYPQHKTLARGGSFFVQKSLMVGGLSIIKQGSPKD